MDKRSRPMKRATIRAAKPSTTTQSVVIELAEFAGTQFNRHSLQARHTRCAGVEMATRNLNAEHALMRLIGTISEDLYCAGWMIGIEKQLWRIIQPGVVFNASQTENIAKDVLALKWLSGQCGGWMYWDQDGSYGEPQHEPTFIAMDEWLKRV